MTNAARGTRAAPNLRCAQGDRSSPSGGTGTATARGQGLHVFPTLNHRPEKQKEQQGRKNPIPLATDGVGEPARRRRGRGCPPPRGSGGAAPSRGAASRPRAGGLWGAHPIDGDLWGESGRTIPAPRPISGVLSCSLHAAHPIDGDLWGESGRTIPVRCPISGVLSCSWHAALP